MAADAEAALNALKKLEVNKTCVNCGNYNRFGHQNICEKVRTFVCSNCKSAHQSYSMRVKNVSMSNWTMDEVDALREENGGGNAAAARIWLCRWDDSQMRKPTKEDSLDYYKQFVNRVYNDKAYYSEDGVDAAATSSGQSAAAVSNLLDFDAPNLQGGLNASRMSSNSTSNDEWGHFAAAPARVSSNDEFGAFMSASVPTPSIPSDSGASFTAALAASDSFGAFASAPPAPKSSSVDPFAVSGHTINALSASFDPFATQQRQTSAANIMNQFNATPAPVDFSVFDAVATPSPTRGTPERHTHGYGQTRGFPGMQGRGQQMPRGIGVGLQQGGLQQQNPMQHQSMMGGRNLGTKFVPTGGAAGGQIKSKDPFAGLGLPPK